MRDLKTCSIRDDIMGKKHHYEIVLNDGQNTCQPLTYNFRSTPNIELYISSQRARIVFEQGVIHDPEEFLTSKDTLRTDAVKKVMLLHLLKYGTPLDICSVNIVVDDVQRCVFNPKPGDVPLIYSMVEGALDHPLPDGWRDDNVLRMILSMPKSSYDGRMNALVALLIAKSKKYYCEKSMYLWISMNGFYCFLAESVKKAYQTKISDLGKEWQQLRYFREVMHLPRSKKRIKDDDEDIVCKKALSILCHLEMMPEELYSKLMSGRETEYSEKLTELLNEYDADFDPLAFLVTWLPYQIRCNYFHANQAMPLFLYADELLLKSLAYTNYFVERFIEENLSRWMQAKDLSVADIKELCNAYDALPKTKL